MLYSCSNRGLLYVSFACKQYRPFYFGSNNVIAKVRFIDSLTQSTDYPGSNAPTTSYNQMSPSASGSPGMYTEHFSFDIWR